MHARSSNDDDDDDIAVFSEYVPSYINTFLLTIFRISMQSYMCDNDVLQNIESPASTE